MKEVFYIKQISRLEKEHGVKKGYIKNIRGGFYQTCHKKYYVKDNIAAKIWHDLDYNYEKVKQIELEDKERNSMLNE